MRSNKTNIYALAAVLAITLLISVNSVKVGSRFRSTQTSNATDESTDSTNNSSIYNGSNTNNTRSQLCPVASGDNINIDAALSNFTAGLGNDVTGDQSGFNGDYATGIVNGLGAAGTAINNGVSSVGSDIADAADNVYNGAANVVKGVGNSIGDAAYRIGNFFSSQNTVTANNTGKDGTSTSSTNTTIHNIRNNISNTLDSQTTWSQADGNYNDIVLNLRIILYLNQDFIKSDVKIDNTGINIDSKSKCTFITNGGYPRNTDACVAGYNVIQPYLVDFAAAAAINDTIAAIYWVTQILPAMPDLSNACIDAGFNVLERSYDSSNCAEAIEDLATAVTDIQTGSYFSTTTEQLSNRYIITRYIPRVAAYCLGTQN